jgi:cytoskeletal protein CcmA (bactofilin family)
MITTIPKGITISGTIRAEEAVTIGGTVTGDVLVSNHDVTVEVGGSVEGAVTGRQITVRGTSRGRLIAREIVRVLQSASVRADIASPKIALEDGATFTGTVEPARTDAAMSVTAYRNKNEPAVTAAG